MQKRHVTLCLLLAIPLAYAHSPEGTPKNYCEDPSEWNIHDYAPPATGLFILLLEDGNLAGDCDGDGVPLNYDAHSEFALGGAWLMADSGDGVTEGSVACYGEEGHHGGTITVVDFVLGTTVPFSVESDYITLAPPTDPAAPNCGDFQSDASISCVGTCTAPFPAGSDGAYLVYVGDVVTGSVGTLGHVDSPEGYSPPPPPPPGNVDCTGHTDSDNEDCRGKDCGAHIKMAVHIVADDRDENVAAAGTCRESHASCAETDGECSRTADFATSSTASWSCHFEAHDGWYAPDNGFTYNCYTTPGTPFAAGARETAPRGLVTLEMACEALASGTCDPALRAALAQVWAPDAHAQIIGRVVGGSARGVACNEVQGCWAVLPACRPLADERVACEVLPGRRPTE